MDAYAGSCPRRECLLTGINRLWLTSFAQLGLSFANIIEEIIRNTGTTPSESAYVSSENTDPLRSGSAALDPAFYDPNANAVPGLPTVDAENLDAWRYW